MCLLSSTRVWEALVSSLFFKFFYHRSKLPSWPNLIFPDWFLSLWLVVLSSPSCLLLLTFTKLLYNSNQLWVFLIHLPGAHFTFLYLVYSYPFLKTAPSWLPSTTRLDWTPLPWHPAWTSLRTPIIQFTCKFTGGILQNSWEEMFFKCSKVLSNLEIQWFRDLQEWLCNNHLRTPSLPQCILDQ